MADAPLPVILQRARNGKVLVVDNICAEEAYEMHAADLAQFIQEHEDKPTRWVWDDSTQWYPELLAAGVRVKYCTDLRLTHKILCNAPSTDKDLLASQDSARWDNFAVKELESSTLFSFDRVDSLDAMAEYQRQEMAIERSRWPQRLRLLLNAESTASLIAIEMKYAGLPWSTDRHSQILTKLLGPRPAPGRRPKALQALADVVRSELRNNELNPDSPSDLLRALRNAGIDVADTRSTTLKPIVHPVIEPLLEYKKLQRLHSANGWTWLDTWVKDNRYRPTYVPGGVVSGRWATSGGGALSLPSQLRPAVIADEGWKLVVADVAQLEPRVLAGMSGDTTMAQAACGVDLYQNLADSGVVNSRNEAKLALLGAMYGATRGESGALVERMSRRYPKAFALVAEAARSGEGGEIVESLLGRGSPRPTGNWVEGIGDNVRDHEMNTNNRRSWGRFTRNFVVQATGAEWTLCWIAALRALLWKLDESNELLNKAHLVFFLHDEIVVHAPVAQVDGVVAAITEAAQVAKRLLFKNFPIEFPLDVSVVDVYSEAM